MSLVEETNLEEVLATSTQETKETPKEELVSTPDEPVEETSTEVESEVPLAPTEYTDEEFEAVHINSVDESRLTPLQKKVYLKEKNLEKYYHKKYEELANAKRTLEKPEAPNQPKDIYEAYDRDPQGVLDNVYAVLEQKRVEDPYSSEVTRLERIKTQLEQRGMKNALSAIENERLRQHDEFVSKAVFQEMQSKITDFPEKAEKITNFAYSKGFTAEEVKFFSDPKAMNALSRATGGIVSPETAVKFTMLMNELYDHSNSGKTIKPKSLKPPKVEKAGSGSPSQPKSTPDDYFAMMAKSRSR